MKALLAHEKSNKNTEVHLGFLNWNEFLFQGEISKSYIEVNPIVLPNP